MDSRSITAVIGLQWGDEAKGKIVDLMTDRHDLVVRYLGGNNAGHTVVFGGKSYKLSLLPAGILRPGVDSVIASGVVINPKALFTEMQTLIDQGVEPGNLMISDRAHVILPYHLLEDAALEKQRGESAIGTTMRGIGPCYRDKAGRTHAIRMGDLIRPEIFRKRVEEIVPRKNEWLKLIDPEFTPLDAEQVIEEYNGYADRLRDKVIDTTSYLHRAVRSGRSILFEGAQGSLLDVDHGTFPYVTSSNSSGAGIHPGSGVPERAITRLIGVVKAYTTRVGGGPCPTELKNEIGEHIRQEGREFGTVTGRPRRCGWFDAVASSYGARISGADCLGVMLLDVLGKLDDLKICEAYEIDGERTTDFPSHVEDLAKAKPIYRTVKGWKSDISQIKKLADLPKGTREYVDAICELLELPAYLLSVGPDRDQTIWVE